MTEAASAAAPPAFTTRSPWRTATVTALRPLTPRIRGVTLAVPGWPGHRAGQHVTLRLTAPDGYAAKRDYSIASAAGHVPGDADAELIELAVDLLPDGEVSPFLHEVLALGDVLDLRGPLGGHFAWEAKDGGPVLLVGGGSGAVPLVAMLRERALRAPDVPMALLLAARTWEDVPYRDELLALDASSGPVGVILATSREAARRPGDVTGRINAGALARALARLPARPRHAFICGSTPFVEAAAHLALAAGLPAASVRTERYGGA